MKGAFFSQQIEYRLEIKKDGFTQGDEVPATFIVKNHGSAAQTCAALQLILAFGSNKDVKEKKENCLETLEVAPLPVPVSIEPGREVAFPHTFRLNRNCPVTDKSQTLYVAYGADGGVTNQLPLAVEPHPHMKEIFRTLENVHQFVLKSVKTAKWAPDGYCVEAKFKPSSAPKFSTLEEMTVRFHFQDGELVMSCQYKVKKFDASGSKIAVKKAKKEHEVRLQESRYIVGGFLDHAVIDASVNEALEQVASPM